MLTIWPERLELSADFPVFIARSLLGAEVRFSRDRISRSCRQVLFRLKRLGLKPRFRPATLSLSGSGAPLPHEGRELLDRLIQEELRRHFEGEPPRIRQALRSYLANALLNKLLYVTVVETWVRSQNLPPEDHEIVLKRHPANSILKGYLRRRGYRVRESLSCTESLKITLIPFYRIILAVLPVQVDAASLGDAVLGRPALWIEYENLLLYRKRSLLFWKEHVAPRDFDIVCYFDRKDTETTPEVTTRIKSEGMRWLDCRAPYRLARLSGVECLTLARRAVDYDWKKPWWFHFFRLRYETTRYLYRALYSRFAVKALIQHQEASWPPNAQAEAVEEAGGIMLGSHGSNYPQYNFNTHTHPQHVYFVWGRFMRETLEKKGHTCRHMLPCGLWILPEKKAPLPASRLREGLRFVLAVFDSSVAFEVYHSPRDLSSFYLTVIGLLETHPTWGALAKRKGVGGLDGLSALPRGREIVGRLQALVDGGRSVFIDHAVSPATVCQGTDLTVCFGVNTTGIVAGILGGRAVHWDCAGYVQHPIYSDPGQKILYRHLSGLEQAVVAAAEGDKTIGDFSAWRRRFNEFDDEKAPERVGSFIQSYLEDVVKTGDSKGALERSVAAYLETNRVEPGFFIDSGLWDARPMARA